MQQLTIVLVLLSVFLIFCSGQFCSEERGWTCDGGIIRTIQFVDDDDLTITQADSFCTLVQDGSYDVDEGSNTLEMDFSGLLTQRFGCRIIGEDDPNCDQECYEDTLTFTFPDGSGCKLNGPNGEVCTPAVPTAECASRSCPDGEELVVDPNNPGGVNGCGPASIPFSGPSFSFADCCAGHDLCYGGCDAVSKVECDNQFYECMYCSCYDQYDDLQVPLCLELACTYYQLVDEFGCDAWQSSQENGCICEAQKDLPRTYVEVPSKWGPNPEAYLTKRDLLCNAPLDLEPEVCDNPDDNDGNNSNSNGGSNSGNNSGSSDASFVAYSFVLFALVALIL